MTSYVQYGIEQCNHPDMAFIVRPISGPDGSRQFMRILGTLRPLSWSWIGNVPYIISVLE